MGLTDDMDTLLTLDGKGKEAKREALERIVASRLTAIEQELETLRAHHATEIAFDALLESEASRAYFDRLYPELRGAHRPTSEKLAATYAKLSHGWDTLPPDEATFAALPSTSESVWLCTSSGEDMGTVICEVVATQDDALAWLTAQYHDYGGMAEGLSPIEPECVQGGRETWSFRHGMDDWQVTKWSIARIASSSSASITSQTGFNGEEGG